MGFIQRGAVLTAVVAAGAGLVSTLTVPSGPHSDTFTVAVSPTASASLMDLTAGTVMDSSVVGAAEAAAGAAAASTDWWDDIIGFGQYQIGDGLGYLSEGYLSYGLAVLGAGLANILVYGPQAAFMASIDDAVGQDAYWQWLPYAYPFSESNFEDWGDLFSFVQDRISSGLEWISFGFEELGQGVINYGLGDVFWGINELTVNLSLGLLVGPMAILEGF